MSGTWREENELRVIIMCAPDIHSNPLIMKPFVFITHRRVGDRIGVSPTADLAKGSGEEFTIVGIDPIVGSLVLDKPALYNHGASLVPPYYDGGGGSGDSVVPALMSAEVVNLSRNVVITGDEFRHVGCDSSLPEAVDGEQTSVLGCRCSSFRSKCTVGLHTAMMNGGSARIQNTRIERCGQRGEHYSHARGI